MAGTSSGKLDLVPVAEQFPVGLRVLVVDDDVICLRILEQMLRKCMYNVTSCSQATAALNLLRERKGCFDIVLSDVHMPDMDGFKLLELVGLEMDLPVIMMSADGRTNLVMRGIRHGACDYLIKPIRDEELKNIWQHVIRKKWNEIKENDHSGSIDDHDRQKRAIDDVEYASSANQGADDIHKTQKKKRDSKDDDDVELENDDLNAAKKPRVVWSVELHQQFVSAVNQLGIDKAVPKRILELMNVPGLTRENVASHLQKFRLYLKRLSGVTQQQGILPPYCGPVEQNLKLAAFGRFDIQALATSGQLPPQTLAALHAELLSRPTGNLVLPAMEQRNLSHVSSPRSKCFPVDQSVTYGQPLIKCSSKIPKQNSEPIISNENVLSEFAAWSSKNLGDMAPASNIAPVVEAHSNMLMNFMQQQQKQPMALEPSRSINVPPSCLVVPSQSSANFLSGNSPVSVNPNCGFRNSVLDYNNPLLQSDNSSDLDQVLEIECKPMHLHSDIRITSSVSSVPSCSRSVQESACGRVPSSPATINTTQSPNMNCSSGPGQGSSRIPAYIGKGTPIPSRFAVTEHELPSSNKSQVELCSQNNGNKVKQEPNMDLMENIKVGTPIPQHLPPPNNPMRVFPD